MIGRERKYESPGHNGGCSKEGREYTQVLLAIQGIKEDYLRSLRERKQELMRSPRVKES